jgi:hypothetical protein
MRQAERADNPITNGAHLIRLMRELPDSIRESLTLRPKTHKWVPECNSRLEHGVC